MAVEHIRGDNSTSVPNISLYLFFSLKSLNSLSGRNTTTAVTVGTTSSIRTPRNAATVTIRSNTFQPELIYSLQPRESERIKASSKNTKKKWY